MPCLSAFESHIFLLRLQQSKYIGFPKLIYFDCMIILQVLLSINDRNNYYLRTYNSQNICNFATVEYLIE